MSSISTTRNTTAAALTVLGDIQVIASNPGATVPASTGPFRPPSWSQPAITMITVPAAYTTTSTSPSLSQQASNLDSEGTVDAPYTLQVGIKGPIDAGPTIYVFDAVFRISHSQSVGISQNPTQTGSNIADHAILRPAKITLAIGMSDVMDSYTPGQWQGNASKSVNTFQVLDSLRAARVPLTVTTRLKTYTNMLIEDIRADDTVKTAYGLSAVIEFQQIFVAQVALQGVSARPQTTDSTDGGNVQGQSVPSGVVVINRLPTSGPNSASAVQSTLGSVPGAGSWSSNGTVTLPSYVAGSLTD